MVLAGLSLRLAKTAGRGFALGDVRLGNTSDRRSPGAVSFPEIALHEDLGLGTAIWGDRSASIRTNTETNKSQRLAYINSRSRS